MSDKEKKISITLFVLAIVFTIMGSTLAYWNWQTGLNDQTNVTFRVTSDFSCGADGGGSITSQEKILAPTTCTNENYAFQRPIVVKPTINKNGKTIYMDLYLQVNQIGTYLAQTPYFRYALTTDSTSCTSGVIASGSFQGTSSNSKVYLLNNKSYSSTTNDPYYLYVWLDKDETDNRTQNQPFNISLGGTCTDETPTLLTPIKKNAVMDNVSSTYVTSNTGIDFTQMSSDTNGKGVYIRNGTENDTNPIYYYRGDVDDNNVYFANYCWKIVRSTETGGLKLIYNGEPTINATCDDNSFEEPLIGLTPEEEKQAKVLPLINNLNNKNNILKLSTSQNNSSIGSSKFNTNYNDAKYVGYMYDNNTVDSTVKGVIDTWYHDNILTNYATYLEDTVFCNDRTTHALSEFTQAEIENEYLEEGTTIYGPVYRHAKGTPSLTCPNTTDAFTLPGNASGNGKLTYPVGLLTMDEIMLAGADNQYSENNTYYLYDGSWWWSLSPNDFIAGNAYVWHVSDLGYLGIDFVAVERGVRPVVSLKPGQVFGYGNGSGANPYRFVETITPGSGGGGSVSR